MTQRIQYRNPYDFVPLEVRPTYLPETSQALLTGLSGYITFDLEILTPLCIHHSPGEPDAQGLHRFAHLNQQPVLPATSLKGMLRNVYETVTNSTMGLLGTRQGWYRKSIPDAYLPGGSGTRLTAAESVFGMVGGEGTQSVGYAGKILLDDIAVAGALKPAKISRPAGGQPKPEHKSFYFEAGAGKNILGRKFYYHQRNYEQVAQVYAHERRMPTITVESIPSQTHLSGTLRFFNLCERELAALVYTLVLEDGLAHKLGYGKPLGLGSVRIRISALCMESQVTIDTLNAIVPARFWNYDEAGTDDWTDRVNTLRDTAKSTWLAPARSGGAQSYAAFTAIARWPQVENFVYPDYQFFRRSPTTPLWTYQGRTAYHPGTELPFDRAVQPHQELPTVTRPEDIPAAASFELPPPSPRRTGVFKRSDDIGYFVEDAQDGTRCQYQTTDSRARKLLRRLAAQLGEGPPIRVSYRRAQQPSIEGTLQEVALDVEILEGDA